MELFLYYPVIGLIVVYLSSRFDPVVEKADVNMMIPILIFLIWPLIVSIYIIYAVSKLGDKHSTRKKE